MRGGEIRAAGTSQKLIAAMPERVWSVDIPKKDMETYMKAYKIANVKTTPYGANLRIISSKKPAEHAVLENATLEDLFLNYFGERAGESNDEI